MLDDRGPDVALARPTGRQVFVVGCATLLLAVVGAQVISFFERPAAQESRTRYARQLADLIEKGDFSFEQLAIVKQIVSHHGNHWCMPHMANEDPWGFGSAFYFVIVLISTVGYGDLAPETQAGKFTAVLVSLLGIPLLLSFTVPLARSMIFAVTTQVRRRYITRAVKNAMDAVEMRRGCDDQTDGSLDSRMPTMSGIGLQPADIWVIELTTSFVLLLFILAACAAVAPALVLSEGWAHEDALAFVWYTVTTIGLGDKTIDLARPYLSTGVLLGLLLLGTSAAQALMHVMQHAAVVVERTVFTQRPDGSRPGTRRAPPSSFGRSSAEKPLRSLRREDSGDFGETQSLLGSQT